MIMRLLTASMVAPVLVLLASSPSIAAAQQRDRGDRASIDTSFAFERTGTVSVGNGSATIVVTGWDKPMIQIRARADEGSVRLEASSRLVSIEPTRSHDDVTIELQVPRGVKIDARTNSGDITIHGTGGDVDVQTSSG